MLLSLGFRLPIRAQLMILAVAGCSISAWGVRGLTVLVVMKDGRIRGLL